jgi:DNA mismatch endonuclease (patch repair protein)
MAAVRSRNTRPENFVRKGLHARGLRYRLHVRELPGRPDMLFPKYRAALFIHGCFWHGHGCSLFRLPGTRTAFWRAKIRSNVARDSTVLVALQSSGWRTGIVWECAVRGRARRSPDDVLNQVTDWLKSGRGDLSLTGFETNGDNAPTVTI